MAYTADKPGQTPDPDELRGRIPGWGADLDPEDRPAFPREQPAPNEIVASIAATTAIALRDVMR